MAEAALRQHARKHLPQDLNDLPTPLRVAQLILVEYRHRHVLLDRTVHLPPQLLLKVSYIGLIQEVQRRLKILTQARRL